MLLGRLKRTTDAAPRLGPARLKTTLIQRPVGFRSLRGSPRVIHELTYSQGIVNPTGGNQSEVDWTRLRWRCRVSPACSYCGLQSGAPKVDSIRHLSLGLVVRSGHECTGGVPSVQCVLAMCTPERQHFEP